jgi:GH24 family phage-related lysozyme (muramidase)
MYNISREKTIKPIMNISKIITKTGYINWYDRQYIYQSICQEAGFKEGLIGNILGALMLVLSGYTIHEASKETKIPENEIQMAFEDESIVEKARNAVKEMTQPDTDMVEYSSGSLDSFLNEAFEYIGKNEGIKLKPYIDTEGNPTIGIGHKIRDGEDFSGGITIEEAKKIFSQDVQEKLNIARSLFPKFDTYPNYIKVALLDGVFRGDHKRTYKTTKLINNDQWIDASQEYTNDRPDYDRSKTKGTGVYRRMDENARRMAEYGKEIAR